MGNSLSKFHATISKILYKVPTSVTYNDIWNFTCILQSGALQSLVLCCIGISKQSGARQSLVLCCVISKQSGALQSLVLCCIGISKQSGALQSLVLCCLGISKQSGALQSLLSCLGMRPRRLPSTVVWCWENVVAMSSWPRSCCMTRNSSTSSHM